MKSGWARLSSGPTQIVGATPIALFLREHAEQWMALRQRDAEQMPAAVERSAGSGQAGTVLDYLRTCGASFAHDVRHCIEPRLPRNCVTAWQSSSRTDVISSDGFSGLRGDHRTVRDAAPIARAWQWSVQEARRAAGLCCVRRMKARAIVRAPSRCWRGRCFAATASMFRRLLVREAGGVAWRELARVYRRLEARGEIRGGRFVSGMSGEQFALPDAVDRLREIRRSSPNDELIAIGAADPLNLVGILTDGERIRVSTGRTRRLPPGYCRRRTRRRHAADAGASRWRDCGAGSRPGGRPTRARDRRLRRTVVVVGRVLLDPPTDPWTRRRHAVFFSIHFANVCMKRSSSCRVVSLVMFPSWSNRLAAPPMYTSGCCIGGISRNTSDWRR